MILSEKNCVNLALFALFIKMLISPWTTGSYEQEGMKLLNYACDGLILLTILAYIPYVLKLFSFVYLVFFILLLSLVTSTLIYTDGSVFDAVNSHLRVYSPFLFFTMLASYFSKAPRFAVSISIKFCVFTVILLIVGLMFLPSSENRLELWWPAYFGSIHTTSFMAMSVFFISFALLMVGEVKKNTLLFIGVVVLYCVFWGWGVRTVSGAILILLGVFYLNKIRFNSNQGLLRVVAISILLIFSFMIVFIFDFRTFDNFTSGRISMYGVKLDQLSNNTFFNWLLGNGAGSDLIMTDFWWWAAKGAHSDFITFLVEGGLIYFGLTSYTVIKFYKLLNRSEGKLLLISFIFTSLISNGYLVRPLPSYLFFFSLAIVYAFYNKRDMNER
tara:strand:- start:203907 stop:205064 length:1158 start_codon:yes stop_codon:yes gene_type:complete